MFHPYPKQVSKVKEPKFLKRTGIAKRYQPTGEMQMFKEIWVERAHVCEWCLDHLGSLLKPIFFDHIIEKSKSEALRLNKANIRLLCRDCHNARHTGTKKQIAERLAIGENKAKLKINTALDQKIRIVR